MTTLGLLIKLAEKDRDDRLKPIQTAAAAGAVASGVSLGKVLIREHKERNIPKARSWSKFVKQLKPGDILVSKRAVSSSTKKDMDGVISAGLHALGGSKHVHASMYVGNGKILHAAGRPGKTQFDRGGFQFNDADVIALRTNYKKRDVNIGK